jgi:uncharacterized membrane protein YdjX (TVP38/TMEM64 family)
VKKLTLESILTVLITVLVVTLAYWFLVRDCRPAALAWLEPPIVRARDFYAANHLLAIVVFCCAHLVCSTTGLPGGCTSLNIVSGAVFGFWRGCAVVYSVTLLSALLVYELGSRLGGLAIFSRYRTRAEILLRHPERLLGRPLGRFWGHFLGRHDFLFLVSLRLSPLLPFGVLNFFAGVMRMPLALFFSTTLIGIFFDVILLNSVGAALQINDDASNTARGLIGVSFLVLLCLFLWVRRALRISQETAV